eukprot:TRINITY_DN5114_c0_g1_i2.p1 TRINITY_DN5114_c0_g1~~TRINITY_DN5114_c0_g1_i2.p1  ORF type:complete len:508 (+),score=81.00 TRINITY_DN5114_c0_g1_i2:126-1649(+)
MERQHPQRAAAGDYHCRDCGRTVPAGNVELHRVRCPAASGPNVRAAPVTVGAALDPPATQHEQRQLLSPPRPPSRRESPAGSAEVPPGGSRSPELASPGRASADADPSPLSPRLAAVPRGWQAEREMVRSGHTAAAERRVDMMTRIGHALAGVRRPQDSQGYAGDAGPLQGDRTSPRDLGSDASRRRRESQRMMELRAAGYSHATALALDAVEQAQRTAVDLGSDASRRRQQQQQHYQQHAGPQSAHVHAQQPGLHHVQQAQQQLLFNQALQPQQTLPHQQPAGSAAPWPQAQRHHQQQQYPLQMQRLQQQLVQRQPQPGHMPLEMPTPRNHAATHADRRVEQRQQQMQQHHRQQDQQFMLPSAQQPVPLSARTPRAGQSTRAPDVFPQPQAQWPHGRYQQWVPGHQQTTPEAESAALAKAAEAELIRNLPTHVTTAEQLKAAEDAGRSWVSKGCAICLEQFQAGEVQKMLPCFHQFHEDCVDEWLERSGTCPVCKHRLDSLIVGGS